jgi:16S rRNA (cytidine1402-2'-O)-methyltransferase
VALVSDAGTPLVSDPGYRLVEQAREAGIRVVPIPGPSAVLAALTASGLPSDAFLFAGFLPVKDGAAARRLEELKSGPGDADLLRIAAPAGRHARRDVRRARRPPGVRRPRTDQDVRGVPARPLAELAAHYAQADTPKGEVVICVGPPQEAAGRRHDIDRLLLSLAAEMPASKAAGEAARMTGAKKPDLYRRLLELREG